MHQIKGGLQSLPEDKRDFKLGSIFTMGSLEDLPESFALPLPYPAKNQEGTDYCSAFASCGMSELQEGVELDPQYSFAISKMISEDPEAWGQNMRDAMKAHVKIGAVELGLHSFSLGDRDARYFKRYPEYMKNEAIKHQKQSYMTVRGPYSGFDDIRLALWKFREEKRAVAIGVLFSWDVSDKVMDTLSPNGFGHMMYAYGFEGDYLLVRNSYGEDAGDNGNHKIHKDIINDSVDKYGAMMLIDLPRKEVERRIKLGLKDTDNWFVRFIKYLNSLWK